MIKIETIQTYGWQAAIRGMRNPMNSWEKSDSQFSCMGCDDVVTISDTTIGFGPISDYGVLLGKNDYDLAKRLAKSGSEHAKYRRMINVSMDITAPLYWWKEFDTYKVGTVADSCSTMHKIHAKEFTLDDFSYEHLRQQSLDILYQIIGHLNTHRAAYLAVSTDMNRNEESRAKLKKDIWWEMIQLLPSSYNQKRTVQLNYEVLSGIYRQRKDHKLDEWKEFCQTMKQNLPYSELFTLEFKSEK